MSQLDNFSSFQSSMSEIQSSLDQMGRINSQFLSQNQEKISQFGEALLNEQKTSIKSNLSEAISKYHHPKMKVEEIQAIIYNVTDRTEKPDISETFRAMIL